MLEDFIFMFLGLDPVLCILGYLFIVYVTLFKLIVLYSRYRVNGVQICLLSCMM